MSTKPASLADAAYARVRAICLGFPGAEEKLSHGAPWFHVRGRMFAAFYDDHHGDGRLALWCKATPDEQRELVAREPARFFVPPYVGVKGWVGVRLDAPDADYVELAVIVEDAWRSVAPRGARGEIPAVAPAKPVRVTRTTTDAELARAALARLDAMCLAFPEAAREGRGAHATFRVRKKPFVYFWDNHHGDGMIVACVKAKRGENARLAKAEPARYSVPPYIGAHGWVAVRLDARGVDWDALAARVAASYAAAAPKGLADAAARAGSAARGARSGRARRAPARAGR